MDTEMAAGWFWGDLPAGFEKLRAAPARLIIVRGAAAAEIDLEKLPTDARAGTEESPFHGRAKLAHLRLGNGTSALVRSYRHGGVMRRLTGGMFCTWPPRPFRELSITEEARRAGGPTVEILGA